MFLLLQHLTQEPCQQGAMQHRKVRLKILHFPIFLFEPDKSFQIKMFIQLPVLVCHFLLFPFHMDNTFYNVFYQHQDWNCIQLVKINYQVEILLLHLCLIFHQICKLGIKHLQILLFFRQVFFALQLFIQLIVFLSIPIIFQPKVQLIFLNQKQAFSMLFSPFSDYPCFQINQQDLISLLCLRQILYSI